jgi:hypothetical protein
MIDERQRYEEAVHRFAPPEHAFDRLVQRRTRGVRRQRLAAGAVALAVVVAAFGLGLQILRSESQPAVKPIPSVAGPTLPLPRQTGLGETSAVNPSRFHDYVPPGTTEMATSRTGELVFVVNDRITLYLAERYLRYLSPRTVRAMQPSFAPNGSRIAFAVRGAAGGIYVVDRDAGGLTRLTWSGADADPEWSPDGSQLVFNRAQDLYTISSSGGQPQLLVRNGVAPQWTAGRIVFVRGNHTWAVAVDGGRPRRLVFEAG